MCCRSLIHLRVGWRCGRISKSSANQDYGGETFAAHEEIDVGSLMERDKSCQQKNNWMGMGRYVMLVQTHPVSYIPGVVDFPNLLA